MSTVSKTNMDEIPDIIDEVVKAKAKVFCIFTLCAYKLLRLNKNCTPQNTENFLECVGLKVICIGEDAEAIITKMINW